VVGVGRGPDEGPARGEKAGKTPTDRGKSGAKAGLPVETNGLPGELAIDGANRQDKAAGGRPVDHPALQRGDEVGGQFGSRPLGLAGPQAVEAAFQVSVEPALDGAGVMPKARPIS
jgi:hypothetical protein